MELCLAYSDRDVDLKTYTHIRYETARGLVRAEATIIPLSVNQTPYRQYSKAFFLFAAPPSLLRSPHAKADWVVRGNVVTPVVPYFSCLATACYLHLYLRPNTCRQDNFLLTCIRLTLQNHNKFVCGLIYDLI